MCFGMIEVECKEMFLTAEHEIREARLDPDPPPPTLYTLLIKIIKVHFNNTVLDLNERSILEKSLHLKNLHNVAF